MGCGSSKDEETEMPDDENARGSSGDGQDKKKKAKTGKELDYNFKPINILVYRNGDEYDTGTIIAITRRRFRNWVSLLDFTTATVKLKEGAVHRLFLVDGGTEARHFKDLQDGERYVAVHKKFNKNVQYGTRPNGKWSNGAYAKNRDPGGITSGESYSMYLEKRDFRPTLDDMWEDSGFDLKRSTNRSASSDPPRDRKK